MSGGGGNGKISDAANFFGGAGKRSDFNLDAVVAGFFVGFGADGNLAGVFSIGAGFDFGHVCPRGVVVVPIGVVLSFDGIVIINSTKSFNVKLGIR